MGRDYVRKGVETNEISHALSCGQSNKEKL